MAMVWGCLTWVEMLGRPGSVLLRVCNRIEVRRILGPVTCIVRLCWAEVLMIVSCSTTLTRGVVRFMLGTVLTALTTLL